MDSNTIRKVFLGFFEERGHKIVPSSSLIPNDPTLLLTNAGMNQFKPYMLGLEEPPYPRAATLQKVFRTSDIENVGHTARHLTLFQMLGNFSFGDYFKEQAITWAYELVTGGFGLDPDRLWATVFETDDEAAEIWVDHVGLPADRVVRRGKKDNFWDMGVAGPCGPCSEIYVDRGSKYGPDGGPAVDEERFMEIWNLVFMQNLCDDNINIVGELPKKNIDTGSGLERVAVVLQDRDNIFETDQLRPLVEVAESVTRRRYGADERDDVSLRIIAEHGRATTFLMGDGVLPSNEGRGYVLRRMLRRLVTHARKLGVDKPMMGALVARTVELMGETYSELVENRAFIEQVAASEEERFGDTYRQGLSEFTNARNVVVHAPSAEASAEALKPNVFPGDAAFKLHDTYGFPLELTIELAAEEGLVVDTDRFAQLMEGQRRRARSSTLSHGVDAQIVQGFQGTLAAIAGATEFLGYERLQADARVMAMMDDEGHVAERAGQGVRAWVALNRTPFYPEGGGQVGDAGVIRGATGLFRVSDTRLGPGATILHQGHIESGDLAIGEEVEAVVDAERREATARSHTGTHVLHHTLRQTLGEHARQAGSLVQPGRLRFDFTHYEPVPRHRLEEIEYLANRRLAEDDPVRAYETTFDFAKSQGAIALFGEKYGEIVRVVEVGDYSIELCGGTHVHRTGEVALLRLVSEASIGSGFRRVEALTGPDALKQVNVERRLLEEITEAVGGGDPAMTPERVRHAMARIKQLESELAKLRRIEQAAEVETLLGRTRSIGGVSLIVESLAGKEVGELRELAIKLRNKLDHEPAAVILAGSGEGRTLLVAALTKELLSRGLTAASLLEKAAKAVGGSAGGKPDLAMGGGPRSEALDEALRSIPARLEELLAGG